MDLRWGFRSSCVCWGAGWVLRVGLGRVVVASKRTGRKDERRAGYLDLYVFRSQHRGMDK
jgi:hypothetical protein